MTDRATRRYRAAMIEPGSGGACRYCAHSVDLWHVGAWCAECQRLEISCGAAAALERRRRA